MSKAQISKKIVQLILTFLFSVGIVLVVNLYSVFDAKIANILISVVIIIAIILEIIFFKNDKLYKIITLINVGIIIVLLLFFTLKLSGVLGDLTNVNTIKKIILGSGGLGILVFYLINVLQVIILPIPGIITIIAGSLIFGPVTAFLVCTLGILSGSFIAFLIGRTLGKKILNWVDKKGVSGKYLKILEYKGGSILFLMFLLPLFPDDLLCIIAGVSDIKTSKFLLISVIARSIGIAWLSFLGSGKIIPFNNWGIFVWIIIFIISIIMISYTFKYKRKIEN